MSGDSVTTDIAAATIPELTEVDIEWLRGRLHEKHCRQCDLVRTLLAERGGEVGALAEVECGCPNGLGYRFHRHPCSKAGAIDDLHTTPAQQPPDPLAERIEALVQPQWRINRGHEYDTTSEAFAAGRNQIIDELRALVREQHPDGATR